MWQVYTKVNDELINNTVVPQGDDYNFTAVSEDGVIQLIIPKSYAAYKRYTIEYTGTTSLKGIHYLLLFCCRNITEYDDCKWYVSYLVFVSLDTSICSVLCDTYIATVV